MQTADFNYLNITTKQVQQRISAGETLSWLYDQQLVDTTTINKNIYLDPDSYSPELYTSLFELIERKQLPNGNQLNLKKLKYSIQAKVVTPDNAELFTTILTSDYIGPSKNWANTPTRKQSPDFTLAQISAFLWDSRKLGGHLLLPRAIEIPDKGVLRGTTINQQRGGAGGLYDRFDLILLDLKNWYAKRHCYLLTSFTLYQLWLEQFIDFAGFIEFYQLDDFVKIIDGEYVIKNLWPNEKLPTTYFKDEDATAIKAIPQTHDEYQVYVDHSIAVLQARNARIFKTLLIND